MESKVLRLKRTPNAHRNRRRRRFILCLRLPPVSGLNVARGSQMWHTSGTQHWCTHNFRNARYPTSDRSQRGGDCGDISLIHLGAGIVPEGLDGIPK